tara:strand:+ start:1497 stop:1733 length:237 start_codon:yes stop_codon:yes gene_type:complete
MVKSWGSSPKKRVIAKVKDALRTRDSGSKKERRAVAAKEIRGVQHSLKNMAKTSGKGRASQKKLSQRSRAGVKDFWRV